MSNINSCSLSIPFRVKWAVAYLVLGGDDVEQVEEVLQQHAVRPRQGGDEAGIEDEES